MPRGGGDKSDPDWNIQLLHVGRQGYQRCPECGFRVKLPCIKCRTARILAEAGGRVAPAIERDESYADPEFSGSDATQRLRSLRARKTVELLAGEPLYGKIRKLRDAAPGIRVIGLPEGYEFMEDYE